MKTSEQILARIAEVSEDDFLGFERQDLVEYLSYEHAKRYLNEGVTAEQWAKVQSEMMSPTNKIIDYLPFAWEKANNCRGISANRSVSHIKAWLWLDGYDDIANHILDHYEYYGKPCLVIVSELLGFDWQAHDDGAWRNDETSPHAMPVVRQEIIDRMKLIANGYKSAA